MLEEIKNKIAELAEKINAPEDLLPGYGKIKYEAHPYIETDDSGSMYFVISERGQEIERIKAINIDELLYLVFSTITFSMACGYESRHRIRGKDSRRIMFEKQEELLGILNSTWEHKEREEHKRILSDNPYDDLAGLRATYCGELRRKRYSEEEIIKLAYEKYPIR